MKTNKKSVAKSNKKQQKKKIIVTSVAVGAAGILGFFAWQYLKKKKEANKESDLDSLMKTTNAASATYNPTPINKQVTTTSKPKPIYTTTSTDAFPLKKGSKGNNVRLLQEALIAKHGKSILPKYGADGDFGTETGNALKKAGCLQ